MFNTFMFIAGAIYALLNWVVPQSGLFSTLWELFLGGMCGIGFAILMQILVMAFMALIAVGGTLAAHLISKIK